MNEYKIDLSPLVIEDAHYTAPDKPSPFCCILPDNFSKLLDSIDMKYLSGFANGKERMISYISETDVNGNRNVFLISGFFIDNPKLYIQDKRDYAKVKLHLN